MNVDTSKAIASGRWFIRSKWYDSWMLEASRRPKVVRARARMRSGGFRERVMYLEQLARCMNRPAYFEYKLAAVLDRLPVPSAADIAKYDNVPRPMLYFQSPEVCAALDVLYAGKVKL